MSGHAEPNVNGMGAFEGGQLPGELIEARCIASATAALRELGDAAFARVVCEAVRSRPWLVAKNVIEGVTR